jgi:leader peptidase (prepilin peptidase)/N-methyltransferase
MTGFPNFLVALFLAFVGGGAVSAALLLTKTKRLKDRIALGPFLVGATFATIFLGDGIVRWYRGVLGF